MPHQGESKICKMCCEEIAVAAKKCPHCHHWQYRLSLIVFHPLFALIPALVLLVVFGLCYEMVIKDIFAKGEPFQKYADQISITESKMEFGQDQSGPTIAVVGRVKNSSPVDWKDVRIHVEFCNSGGKLVDAGQQNEYSSSRLPANQDIAFKVSLPRQFPESEYASHKIRVFSATDCKQRF
jgi:hypothetical protein